MLIKKSREKLVVTLFANLTVGILLVVTGILMFVFDINIIGRGIYMKVLIIGGTGNISTAITRYLIEQGQNDIYLYNRGNIPVEGTTTSFGDRKDYNDFEIKVAKLGEFDTVIDMICYEPNEARSDVRCFKGKTKQFIFCSTVDTFTKPASRYPIKEDDEQKALYCFSICL